MYISNFIHDHKDVPLTIPSMTNSIENTYTVIVGKNGVGKSRLLAQIVNEYICTETLSPEREFSRDLTKSIQHNGCVVAVSTSPFDKFKIPRRNYDLDYSLVTNYRYVGMRASPYSTSAISLISSATKGILDRFLEDDNYDRLRGIFSTLGFKSNVGMVFKPNFKRMRPVARSNHFRPIEWLKDLEISINTRTHESLERLASSEKRKIRSAIDSLSELIQSEKAVSMELDFNEQSTFKFNKTVFHNRQILESINILLSFNLIKLMDLKLDKKDYGRMSLRRASSGEQCMLVMMLGIAGHICDYSLILIDEPEISLHPCWQEDFMPLLVKTFSQYRGCQFLVATHSPQIVSNLENGNCFVTSMTKNEIYPASYFYKMSSDYQLAELFDAPGYKNEYIARLAFSLLSNLKHNENVGLEDSADLEKLLSMKNMMEPDDPTLELIESIRMVAKHYASA